MTPRSLAVFLLLALAGAGRADLTSPAPDHDAGQLHSGATIVRVFELVNDGKEVVELGEPQAGCGCMKPMLDRVKLGPGEKASLRVVIHTVTQAAGDNSWRVLVPFRQLGVDGAVLLQVRANLIPELQIQPANLILSTESSISHRLTMTDSRPQTFAVHSVATTSPQVVAKATPAMKDGAWTRTITVDVRPDCPEGRHEHTLHIYTDDPKYPDLVVPFTVVKKPADTVKAMPEQVEWRATPGEALPARIVLLNLAEGEVEVKSIEASHPCLNCTFATGPGTRSTLRIRCENEPAGGLVGSVTVHLSKPANKVVTIPVRLMRP